MTDGPVDLDWNPLIGCLVRVVPSDRCKLGGREGGRGGRVKYTYYTGKK